MDIKKIIVELTDHDATFREFKSLTEFIDSDLYKKELENLCKQAEPVVNEEQKNETENI